jgi:hypothetical protein
LIKIRKEKGNECSEKGVEMEQRPTGKISTGFLVVAAVGYRV